jgi:hypothetical protein
LEEQLIKLLSDRFGLDEATAEQAIATVMDFVKDNPEQLTSLLAGEEGQLNLGDVGALKERLGGLFGSL